MNIEIIAITLIFLLSYLLIIKNFEKAILVLLLLSVMLHKELFSFYVWDLMPIRAFMLALFAAGLSSFAYFLFIKRDFQKILSFVKDPVIILLFLLWTVRGLSIFFSLNLRASVFLYGFFSTVIVMAVYLYNYYKSRPENIIKHIKFYVFIVFSLTLFGYFQYYLYQTTGTIIGALWNIPNNIPRVGATFWDVNHYGALLAALLPISAVFVLTEKKLSRKALFVLITISLLVSLVLTNSRTAWIIDGIALLVFSSLFLYRKIGSRGIGLIISMLFLVSIPLLVEYSDKASPFRARVKQYFHYRLDSFDSHFLLLTGTYQIFEEYPLLGGGYGGFFEHFSKTDIAPVYFSRDPAGLNTRVPAHTIWGELIAETGMIGLSIFVLFIAVLSSVLLFGALKGDTFEKSMLSAAMLSVITGWMLAGIFYSYNSEFFWIVLLLFYMYGLYVVNSQATYIEALQFFIKSRFLPAGIILVVSSILIFVGLNSTHLIPWDEAIYAKISKNMVMGNEYVVQRWFPDRVWYEKPPLYMWMTAGLMKYFGFSSIVARFPSAFFGILSVLLVYKFAEKFFTRTAGFIAALALVTTTHFLYYSRASMLDVTCTFFITLSLYFYLARDTKKEWFYLVLSGLSAGLAVMTKGVVGLMPYLIIGVYETYTLLTAKNITWITISKRFLITLSAGMLVALPWHLMMFKMYGTAFIGNYFGYHVFDRAFSAIEDKGRPIFWYLEVMKVSMRIWFVALIPAFGYAIYRIFKGDPRGIFFLTWFALILGFFTAAQSKLTWYIIPIYPVACILVGWFSERVLSFILGKLPMTYTLQLKALLLYFLLISSLFYLFLNRKLVYTTDLTGSQARLLIAKDEIFGKEKKIYLDRMELPLALYYTEGPFEIIDFTPDITSRVPEVSRQNEELILITKKGRFSIEVKRYTYEPVIVKEDGDWVLWYMPSEDEVNGLIKSVKF